MAVAKYKIGDKVVISESGKHVVITDIFEGRGKVIYDVSYNGVDESVLESEIVPDCDITDPFERCKNNLFGKYKDYSKKNTTFKINNTNNSTISSLKASKTIFKAYQFKPLLKFLNSPNRRLLVADEVGLGKTIEAGHIMLELKARNELKNVLIICPKSLQVKWKEELREKFGLNFKIIEKNKELIDLLSDNTEPVKAIINYEKIRKPSEVKIKADETIRRNHRDNLIDFFEANPQKFSLVLCDEAHKMRNRDTQTYRGAEILMRDVDSVLFLTATPVMISEENLYNLLHLLDNVRYFNYEIFKNRMNENKPFVQALSNLNKNTPFSEIKAMLYDSEVEAVFSADEKVIYEDKKLLTDIYKADPIFQEILELLNGVDNKKNRVRLQYLFSTMSMMNTVFSRTRKKDVITTLSQAERKPHFCNIVLTEREQEKFDEIIEEYIDDNSYIDDWGEERMSQGGSLGLIQRKRQIASSVWACMNDDIDLDRGIDAYEDYEDAKVDELLRVIKNVFREGGIRKLVVFALFRKTLKYLQIRLKKAGYNSLIIHGLIDNRSEILYQFKTDDNVHILLSSEVGSEGLDMQFCNSMVNYDLPWNPMVVEQRIGRIDRFGQQAKIVNIYNFVVAGSIQEDIYSSLLEKIGIFKSTIGDIEAILDAQIDFDGKKTTIQKLYNNMEKEFFTKELTKEEKKEKIRVVELAIEKQRQDIEKLEAELTNTLTNDAYFKDEINRILHNNAYVTKEELKNYVDSIINDYLTTCSLDELGNNIYEFKVPLSDSTVLRNFLEQYRDVGDEAETINRQFKRKIEGCEKFKITFDQDVAYNDPTINYLNIYHPMIKACMNYFIYKKDNTQTSFIYSLPSDEVLKSGTGYYMGLYEIITTRRIQGVEKNSSELLPIFFSIEKKDIEKDQNITDRIYRRSQVEGKECNVTKEAMDPSMIDDMRYDFREFLKKEKERRIEEEKRQIESDIQRNIQQTNEYYQSRINSYERSIEDQELLKEYTIDDKLRKNAIGAIRLLEANILKMERERDERLAMINDDRGLELEENMISLNLIEII